MCVVIWVVCNPFMAYHICGETIRVLWSISYNEITKLQYSILGTFFFLNANS